MNEITFGELKQDIADLLQSIKYELHKCQRKADEVILTDKDVMKILDISKRKLFYLKASREIPYYQTKAYSRSYYLLSDILHWFVSSPKIRPFKIRDYTLT